MKITGVTRVSSEYVLLRSQSSSILPAVEAETQFFPKIQILRPDGASLSSVYQYKKENPWAKIIYDKLEEQVCLVFCSFSTFGNQPCIF